MPIVATVDTLNPTHSPGVNLSVTGLTVGQKFTVYRMVTGVADTPVRGLDDVNADFTTMVGKDYEAPIGVPLQYKLVQGATTATSGTLSLSGTINDAWIKSVSQPSLSRKVVVSEWSITEYEPRILGNYKVLGRKKPVVLTDVWGGRTGELVVVTDNNDTVSSVLWQDFFTLLTEGRTLFFQSVSATGEPDMYFEVEGYSRERIGPIRSDGKQTYLHKISFAEVDKPATTEESLGLRSFQDVKDENATFQNVKDRYTSFLALLNTPYPPGG